jgi:hypothetical protein
MWRSRRPARVWLAAAVILVAATGARASFCLPPLMEDGSRLVAATDARVLWLEPLLRQHEVCWRDPAQPGEARIFVIGSSGIFGYPHAADKTAVAIVNRAFDEQGTPAHLFNLGMLWSYAAKDALILREAERYRPDAIVYAVTFDDFYHQSPVGYPPVDNFFLRNSRAVDRAAAEKLTGIGEPFDLYRRFWSDDVAGEAAWRAFREIGSLARVLVRQLAVSSLSAWFPDHLVGMPDSPEPKDDYDCAEVHRFALNWMNWKDWSLLPWLAELERERGTPVLVVNWPVAPDPAGDCFNARYLEANFDDYNAWLRRETEARGLAYLDLHDLLAPEDFLDSIHPGVEGQRAVAVRLEAALRELLPELPQPAVAPDAGGRTASPPTS